MIHANVQQQRCSKSTTSKTNSIYLIWGVNHSHLASEQSVTHFSHINHKHSVTLLLSVHVVVVCKKTPLVPYSSEIKHSPGVYFWPSPKRMQHTDIRMQSSVSSTAFFGKAAWVGGQQLSLWLRCIYSPKRVSRLSCQSCFNDLHRRLLHTSVARSCCVVRCQSRWVARHGAKQAGGEVEM